MEVWPAIDIRAGQCVRLRRGDFTNETVFGDPLEVAGRLLGDGARRLHVVDLDAARTGTATNREIVLRIARGTGLIVQAGGGIRSVADAAALLDNGITRLVVGTRAIDGGESLLEELLVRWPGRIVVSLDYRFVPGDEGRRRLLAQSGWTESSGVSLEEGLRRLGGMPLSAVVVTDIDRDGTGAGPHLGEYQWILEETDLPIIASGGVHSPSDIARLSRLANGTRRLAGVIIGRALLSGALSLSHAHEAATGFTR